MQPMRTEGGWKRVSPMGLKVSRQGKVEEGLVAHPPGMPTTPGMGPLRDLTGMMTCSISGQSLREAGRCCSRLRVLHILACKHGAQQGLMVGKPCLSLTCPWAGRHLWSLPKGACNPWEAGLFLARASAHSQLQPLGSWA